jgi:hypothetical protein
VARAPEPPSPPPFPYQFLGRLEAEGRPFTVYLTKDNQVYSAAPGEVIEGTYRVMNLTAESMELMYLPLNMKQQIAFASIVPTTAPRQASRGSDTPAIVAPTSVNVPPPMNLSPPVASPSRSVAPAAQTAPGEASRSAQRQSNPEQASADRGSAAQQQPGTAAAAGGAPPAAGQPVAAPSLSPGPIVVSPPTLSAFGPAAPGQGSAAGAPPAAGTPPPAPQSGAAAPGAPASGRM